MLPKYDIDTPERVAGFMAQCGHESNNFRVLKENLNYSATALDKIFPKYFRRAGRDAQQYHRQPEKIANVIYANRMDNGDTDSGDGDTPLPNWLQSDSGTGSQDSNTDREDNSTDSSSTKAR